MTDGDVALTQFKRIARMMMAAGALVAMTACGSSSPFGSLGFGGSPRADTAVRQATRVQGAEQVAVNRYLWAASLDVLSFLPIQSVDPFTGVIVTGFGTPPGGSRAYRATVYITDPALDARALNVALQTRSGSAALETQRAVEDAILSRARQLRIADGRL